MMQRKVLILGGYGNFGKRIAFALVKKNIPIIIAGRNSNKAIVLQNEIIAQYPEAKIEIAIFDSHAQLELNLQLQNLKPFVVINTCGPFQLHDYRVAESCIAHHINYIDLSDGRNFVTHITMLDQKAKANHVMVVSGASTVPGLSSAVLEFYKDDFSTIDSLIYGISPGQKASRGLATTESILTYLGKPLKNIQGQTQQIYGWQNLYRQKYPELGKRWMSTCDIPDLDLFPKQYQIKFIQFSAGMESTFLHLGMWLTSWLIRLGLPINLSRHAEPLLNFSHLFDRFGTSAGGMHMLIKGKDLAGNTKEINWFIIAKDGDGPQIPCVPAILLAEKLINNEFQTVGAMPCVGLISLDEYLNALEDFAVETIVEEKN